MKNSAFLLALTLLFSGLVLADEPLKTPPAQSLTPEQVTELKALLKADVANWVALDQKDFVARNGAGEQVNTVKALIHTKKGLEEYRKTIQSKLNVETARVVYEIERSSVIILQCDTRIATLHTISPASGKLPALGDSKPLNPLQTEVLAEEFCK